MSSKKIFIVRAKVTTYCTLEVEANNEEEALQIANDTDGGDFETDNISGDFEVIEATLKTDSIEQETDIVYTSEAGQKYTKKQVLEIAKGNEKLANVLLDLATWQHIETVFQELVNEGEIDSEGNFLNEQDKHDTELVEGRTYARKCSVTGEPMNEGWVVRDGEEYIKYEKDAIKWATDNHYDDLEQAFEDEVIYWTQWCKDDHQYVVEGGFLVEIDY